MPKIIDLDVNKSNIKKVVSEKLSYHSQQACSPSLMMSQPSVLAWSMDNKNQNLYFSHTHKHTQV